MKVTFLGTGTSVGVPMIASNHPVSLSADVRDKRLRASILISYKDVNYVIDCGPDFRQQMLRENVQTLKAVLFTHEHSDHTAGLDDIRPFCFQTGEVPIYAISRVMDSLKHRFYYIFATENRYRSAPKVQVNIVDESPFLVGDLTFEPIQVLHGDLPIVGYKFNSVAYLTDIKYIEDVEVEKLKNLDVLIVSALQIKKHPTHFNLKEALCFIERVQPKKAYLTHVSHHLGFYEEVQNTLPSNVLLAYDGLSFNL